MKPSRASWRRLSDQLGLGNHHGLRKDDFGGLDDRLRRHRDVNSFVQVDRGFSRRS
jgi:hypothetical protein